MTDVTEAVEIERKFLVAQLPVLEDLKAKPVRQGYVTQAGDSVELRLREKGGAFFLTLKSEGGLVRMEREIEIDAAQFEALWPATEGRRLEKTRYVGALPDGTGFELDVFTGTLAPLVLVEVEFDSAEAARAFTPPDWFGADVTEDRRYRNRALADDGVAGRPERRG
ncbi:CYTH domain-containing protein [Alloyangia pacifica]|uniref:CYTH domain-containing protein n=1 Tax=Alloyangia pacifica TaxID=311180 RepID=UPI001CD56F1A|nr:CYTH domain-containing protein [Alloyangia pacifica]MCA0998408.1 CYTH domain-containing protein [Alloyangia pacifica]